MQPITLTDTANANSSSPRGEKGVILAQTASLNHVEMRHNRGRVAASVKQPEPAMFPRGGKAAPPSILHRTNQQQAGPPPTTFALQIPEPVSMPGPVSANPRVRFMSSGESLSSSIDPSQVHLMAGGPGSVASSSAMSSIPGENVFDRVLHAVMAEENQRLNAMGMVVTMTNPKDTYASQHARKQSFGDAPIDLDKMAPSSAAVTRLDMDYHDLSDDDPIPVGRKGLPYAGNCDAALTTADQMKQGRSSTTQHLLGSRWGVSYDDDESPPLVRGGGEGTKSAAAYAAEMKPRARGIQVVRKSGSLSAGRIQSALTKRQSRVDDLAEF